MGTRRQARRPGRYDRLIDVAGAGAAAFAILVFFWAFMVLMAALGQPV